MSKLLKNRIRVGRARHAAIVNAYEPKKRLSAGYYYLENKIKFPFSARCVASKVVSPLHKGETVDVRRLAGLPLTCG